MPQLPTDQICIQLCIQFCRLQMNSKSPSGGDQAAEIPRIIKLQVDNQLCNQIYIQLHWLEMKSKWPSGGNRAAEIPRITALQVDWCLWIDRVQIPWLWFMRLFMFMLQSTPCEIMFLIESLSVCVCVCVCACVCEVSSRSLEGIPRVLGTFPL